MAALGGREDPIGLEVVVVHVVLGEDEALGQQDDAVVLVLGVEEPRVALL